MQKDNDWYFNLKLDLVRLTINSFHFRQEILYLIATNPSTLYDINIDERLSHLIDSENYISKYLEDFKDELITLEETGWAFLKTELLDEFAYIQSIFHFEISYYYKIIDYLSLIDDYSIQGEDIVKNLENNEEDSDFCYKRLKENHQDLKRLKKERRTDYFE